MFSACLICLQHTLAATYSAEQVESTTTVCLRDPHNIGTQLIITTKPDMDCLVSPTAGRRRGGREKDFLSWFRILSGHMVRKLKISLFGFRSDILAKKTTGASLRPVYRNKIGEKRQMLLSTTFNTSTCEPPRFLCHNAILANYNVTNSKKLDNEPITVLIFVKLTSLQYKLTCHVSS